MRTSKSGWKAIRRTSLPFTAEAERVRSKETKNYSIITCHIVLLAGRSGTMVCAYLLRAGLFDRADECLEYFGKRRTDFLEGSKFQGVETPSQVSDVLSRRPRTVRIARLPQQRYVEYYNFILKNGGVVPEPIPLRIRSIQIDAIKGRLIT